MLVVKKVQVHPSWNQMKISFLFGLILDSNDIVTVPYFMKARKDLPGYFGKTYIGLGQDI